METARALRLAGLGAALLFFAAGFRVTFFLAEAFLALAADLEVLAFLAWVGMAAYCRHQDQFARSHA
jgi:hypothetical protein